MTDPNQWQNAAWGTGDDRSGDQPSAGVSSGDAYEHNDESTDFHSYDQGTADPGAYGHGTAMPEGYGHGAGYGQNTGYPNSASAPEAAWGNASAGTGYGAANAYGGNAYAAAYGTAPGPYAYGTPAAAPAKKSRGWIIAVVAILVCFLIMVVAVQSCTSMVTSSMGALALDSGASWTEEVSGDTVGIITIDGAIDYDGSPSSPEGLKAKLDEAEENDAVKAVVLRVNSGGGVATAGEEMAIYIKNFPKPVVVSSAAINASAAYEISSQADYIYTAQTTAIGSIGTIMQVTDLSGLYEKLGISVDNIASADSKDSSYGNRPLTEEERAYYQAQVDQINDTFIKKVADGRSMSEEDVRKLATGLTFTGIDAVENGLADAIGTQEDAVNKACELAGISQAKTVYMEDANYDFSELIDIMGESEDKIDVEKIKELGDRVGLER